MAIMPRFVLLSHDVPAESATPSHWDFMLEHEGALLAWRLIELPSTWLALLEGRPSAELSSVPAERLPDHRLLYLDYEGPISGDRGEVRRIDGGPFGWVGAADAAFEVLLMGETLQCEVQLAVESAAAAGECWRLSTWVTE